MKKNVSCLLVYSLVTLALILLVATVTVKRAFSVIKAVFGCCKTFSGKYIFSGNANFWKRKMFSWCLVAL